MTESGSLPPGRVASLGTVAREWTRIGLTGFGGPPAHIALLRQLMVDRMGWMDAREFQDANAACGLLPGPASTQLSIFCAYRVAGPAGAIVGGTRVHRSGGRPDPRAVAPIPLELAAAVGRAAPAPGRGRQSRPSLFRPPEG